MRKVREEMSPMEFREGEEEVALQQMFLQTMLTKWDNYKYTLVKEHWTEFFVVRIFDGMLEAGIAKVPKGYSKLVRFDDDYDTSYFYRDIFIPFFKLWFVFRDKYFN